MLVLAGALAGGCGAILGVSDIEEGGPGPLPSADGSRDASLEPDGESDDGASGGTPPVSTDPAGCPLGRGPSMLLIGPAPDGGVYCIDRTEVSVAQYAAFVASAAWDAQAPECAWNTPTQPPPDAAALAPVEAVDWCDAKAFCAWAGKRLCGKVGGGPLAPGAASSFESEWRYACTNGGSTAWPYGATYQPGFCNVASDAGLTPVGSLPACANGRGVLDLTGNVWEWIDQCTPADGGPASDGCIFLGGESSSPSSYDCTVASGLARSATPPRVGIRCCADRR